LTTLLLATPTLQTKQREVEKQHNAEQELQGVEQQLAEKRAERHQLDTKLSDAQTRLNALMQEQRASMGK